MCVNGNQQNYRNPSLNYFSQKMTSERNAQIGQARETFQMLYQISQLLCTGLDAETLTICIRLCELGVDPELLASVIKEIRKMGDNSTTTHNRLVQQ